MAIIPIILLFSLTSAQVQESVKPELRDKVLSSVVSVVSYESDGTILVQVLVSESGDVVTAEAIKTRLRRHIGKADEIPIAAEEALKQAAVKAVRQWKFTPTIFEGRPIKVLGTISLNFHL
jgi:hypothetical protein